MIYESTMSGPLQTKAFLVVIVFLALVWEMYVAARYGKHATISWVLGDIFRYDPAYLIIIVVFIMHCAYLGTPTKPPE